MKSIISDKLNGENCNKHQQAEPCAHCVEEHYQKLLELRNRTLTNSSDYGQELVLVQSKKYAVLVSAPDGRVLAEYVRVVDKKNFGKELVFWDLKEIREEIMYSPQDPTTALNAVLSTIELVATGNFEPKETPA